MKIKNNTSTGENNWSIGVILIIIFIILIIGFCNTDYFKQNFGNLFSSPKSKIKELDIVMFMNPNCGWCKKTLELFNREGVTDSIQFVDITTEDGMKIAKQVGADSRPVPSFISKKMRTGVVGYRDNINDFIAEFQPPKEQSSQEVDGGGNSNNGGDNVGGDINIRDLNVIIFTREGCGYCTRAKQACEEIGITNDVSIVDITTEEGRNMSNRLLPPDVSGVPVFISQKTGKHVVGFGGNILDIIKQLK
jgi:glutaredoxin